MLTALHKAGNKNGGNFFRLTTTVVKKFGMPPSAYCLMGAFHLTAKDNLALVGRGGANPVLHVKYSIKVIKEDNHLHPSQPVRPSNLVPRTIV